MLLASSIWIILIGAGLFVVIVFGGRRAKAKDCLARATELARQKEFESARKQILGALRINPHYRTNPEVQALYDVIESKSSDPDANEVIRKMQTALPLLPKTRLEMVFHNAYFRFFVFGVMVFWVIERLAGIFSRV